MKKYELAVQIRKETGKGANRRLRQGGEIPAILYGLGNEKTLKVNESDFMKLMHNPDGTNIIVDMKMKDWNGMAVLKDIHKDPVKDSVVHIDFLEIDMNKPITIPVTVNITGSAAGVKEGGILETNLWELQVEALPSNLPSHIDVDVTGLEIGDALHVSDLTVKDDIKILNDGSELLAHVVAPRLVEETEEKEEGIEFAESTEPEVITSKKEEESEE